MMVILGRMGRFHGAIIGAFAYILLQELLSASTMFGAYAKHWQLAMGSLIVLIVLVLPRGLADLLEYGAVVYKRQRMRAAGKTVNDRATPASPWTIEELRRTRGRR